ncbi:hypothetical protein PHYSODRAFT_326582 [Phytophthora sojae]|uniref:Fe2OG dioxygenase domain-containing protein n=1 Tax=Phytophthora sojae (strain P6497) TaxID=1094619 RepID=G4YWE3_PHYSP|nr:hypothetical protein PHYSODRAFT_326582 [Phytophthora sojae]EGZ25589.1 hypothetical protein PHYSODRAFT_326582 [Phytophthora sojae]|eukprot:XP_009520877.1 hypothetical protein PHYSODRAFT_326582 [Phytophthora sojae]
MSDSDFEKGKWPFGGKGKPEDVPVPSGTARQISNKSPFGHNLETKMDEAVRQSWQLVPSQVRFENMTWQGGMEKLCQLIADRLGYRDIPLQCVLYKLLVYGEGGHFVKHQDTEKEDGMIVTLVVQLPSSHEGGDLVVYRGGEVRHRHDFGKADGTAAFLPHYAVHYADAEHALEKVTKGFRLALVYSICLPPTMRHLEKAHDAPLSEDLAGHISNMDEEADEPFALLLSHEYTAKNIQGLGTGALKGIDSARFHALEEANALVPAAKQLEFFIVKHAEHAVKVMPFDVAMEVFHAQIPVDAAKLRAFMEDMIARAKLAVEAGDPEIVRDFFKGMHYHRNENDTPFAYCAGLRERTDNGTLIPVITQIARKFDWAIIGEPLLACMRQHAYAPKEDDSGYSTMALALLVLDGLDSGTAEDSLLKLAMEKAEDKNSDPMKSLECFGGVDTDDEKGGLLALLVSKRIEWLKNQIEKLDKPFSWQMPDAKFPDNAKVEEFLQGLAETMTMAKGVRKFKGFQDASNYAAKWTRGPQVGASLKMEASSTDANAVVAITKTRKWFTECQHKLRQYKVELTQLREYTGETDDSDSKRARLE